MKLRDRLLLFSTAQLLVFGAVFALGYGAFHLSVLPMFESLLCAKSEQTARTLGAKLEIALAADDLELMHRIAAEIIRDPDFSYIAIRDSRNRTVLAHGDRLPDALFGDAEYLSHSTDHRVRAWAEVSIEGSRLGSVAVVFSTARFDAIRSWAQHIVGGVALIWLIAFGYSLGFGRSLVVPIRAMMDFSRKVAGGSLSQRLTIAAPGELGELRDYLNQMTADLERREAERKLSASHAEGMQRELLAVSRTAGMAEIATGVLHNVGNVLNSLNVSVAMISDQVKSSRIAGLTRSIELIDSFPGGLLAFLDTEKGKVLPSYLTSVSRRLSEENAKVLEELGSVNRHVDHIKTIVAMQQSYARPSGVNEQVALSELVDDALRMGESSFAKHGIEIVKDYASDITLVTDRHKLLQIMINLISNARHALKGHREAAGPALPGPQQLIVRIRIMPDLATIAVIDNGVGIPEANLDNIFRHGFTTKKGGHGFGLHASANTARELGGSLRAQSRGSGTGATFTLELPVASREDQDDLGN